MVEGLARLRRKLTSTIPRHVRRAAKISLEESADQVVATQKALAPVGKTGALKASIRRSAAEERKGGLSVAIEAGGPTTTKPVREGQSSQYDYALGQEFGTAEQSAQAFFYPGYRGNKKRVKAKVSRQTRKAIKDGAK
jgi:HK97 gp10 family phage protein